MTQLYLAIGVFVLTSIVIGFLALTRYNVAWISLIFGFIGAVLLLSASIFLIWESRLAVSSTLAETDFVFRWAELHLHGPKAK